MHDKTAYLEAGGNELHLDLYQELGRVAAFGDGASRALATVHPDLPRIGAIGDWVGDDRVRLEAEEWLRDQGCEVARGPMELMSWFRYRASLGPYDELPFLGEPTEPAERWQAARYEVCAEYVSWLADSGRQIERATDIAGGLAARGWRVESLPADDDGRVSAGVFHEAVGMVHRLGSEAFADAYGYLPVSEDALQAWYAPYRDRLDPRLTYIARAPDGRLAGILVAHPDTAQPERNWFLIKTLAVLPEFGRTGVGQWLVGASHRAATRLGFVGGVHCMVRSKGGADYARSGKPIRRYALLEKAL